MKNWFVLVGVSIMFYSGSGFAQEYAYSDGSANTYKIAPGRLEYIPVKKENSSSGAYSGGTAKTVRLSDADYSSLSVLFNDGIASKASQTDRRVMMSGVIHRNTRNDNATVILKPGAPIKDQIEAKLLDLIRRSN